MFGSNPVTLFRQSSIPKQINTKENKLFTTTPESEIEQYLSLPLLDEMVKLTKNKIDLAGIEDSIWLIRQHALATLIPLIASLLKLGVQAQNIYFSDKCYSTSLAVISYLRQLGIKIIKEKKPTNLGEYEQCAQESVTKLWDLCLKEINGRKISKIIIIDDGGRCIQNMPSKIAMEYKIAAVEQTQGGLNINAISTIPFPLIQVASSAAKKILEPPLIATAIMEKIKKIIDTEKFSHSLVCGVIGNGAIGDAVCRFLLSKGYKVLVFDENDKAFPNIIDKRFFRLASVEELIDLADIIFSCTGKDVTIGRNILETLNKNKTFISCTSEDKEFKSLLRSIAKKNTVVVDPFSKIICYNSARTHKIEIFRGGFPVNFDGSLTSVPAQNIAMTRGLMLGAGIQAFLSATQPVEDGRTINNMRGKQEKLNSYLQRWVALRWLSTQSTDEYSIDYLTVFNNIDWIKENSGGNYRENGTIAKTFNVLPTDENLIPRKCKL